LEEGTLENLRIGGVLEEIGRQYPQDTSLLHYRYANPLGRHKCNRQTAHVTVAILLLDFDNVHESKRGG
jgi:hypothetical protein